MISKEFLLVSCVLALILLPSLAYATSTDINDLSYVDDKINVVYNEKPIDLLVRYPPEVSYGLNFKIFVSYYSSSGTPLPITLAIQNSTSNDDLSRLEISSTDEKTMFMWDLQITEQTNFVLFFDNEPVYGFITSVPQLESKIDMSYPQKVISKELFKIFVNYYSLKPQKIDLKPEPLEVSLTETEDGLSYVFVSKIESSTTFKVVEGEKEVKSFVVETFPLNYCNPSCYEGFLCVENVCKEIIYGFKGDFCDGNINRCAPDFQCENQQCFSILTNKKTDISTSLEPNNSLIENSENETDLIVISDEVVIKNDSVIIKKTSSEEEVKIDNDSKDLIDSEFKKKFEVPSMTKQIMPPIPKKSVVRLENQTKEREFVIIKEQDIIQSEEETNTSKREIKKILYENKLLKADITKHEKKAKEQVKIQKRLVHEKEMIKKESEHIKEELISTKVTIQVQPLQNKSSIDIIEVIPKEVAESAGQLIFNIEPVILEDDPVIMWHLEDIDETVELSYRVEKNVSVTGNTILLSEDVEAEFDWRTLLPLLFIPFFGGLAVLYSKFSEKKTS